MKPRSRTRLSVASQKSSGTSPQPTPTTLKTSVTTNNSPGSTYSPTRTPSRLMISPARKVLLNRVKMPSAAR